MTFEFLLAYVLRLILLLFYGGIQDLRASLECTKLEVLKTRGSYSEEFNSLGT